MTGTALLYVVVLCSASSAVADEFPLWPGPAPRALGEAATDVPTLTVYIPDPARATGAAMVICPGGGYDHLADHEGEGYARWLTESGVTCFVLKYRLGSNGYRHPAMLQDAARAVRTVRARAEEWGIDPDRIGIMGSSAGGHLASALLTHFDAGDPAASDPIERVSSRPDLGVLCYPVISMGEHTHRGSRDNLLGDDPPVDLIEELSNERQVSDDTPPCFVWHSWEDTAVPVENSLAFTAALRRHGVPFDLHIYEKGRHGIGLGQDDRNADRLHPWTGDLLYWLRLHGFVQRRHAKATPPKQNGPSAAALRAMAGPAGPFGTARERRSTRNDSPGKVVRHSLAGRYRDGRVGLREVGHTARLRRLSDGFVARACRPESNPWADKRRIGS